MDNLAPTPPAHQPQEPKEITWQTLEYPEYKKHPLWFIGLALVIAVLVLYGIYIKSWSTIASFALFGVLALIYASQKPKTLTIKINGQGVQVNNILYGYPVIRKFWIVYSPPEVKSLYLETTTYIDHIVKLELSNQDPRVVKTLLKQYLEEDLEAKESTVDLIARKIKF
jgi:hypothetical protein